MTATECPKCHEECGHDETGYCDLDGPGLCPECNDDCGHHERGYCILDECEKCGEWLENCECEEE